MHESLPFFHCYPSDFLAGVLGLEADEIGVYAVILMMIYDRGEPIPEDTESLAWRCRVHVRRFKHVVDRLVSSGKLTRCAGKLSNERAEREIIVRRHKSKIQASNALRRWHKSDENDNKINGPPMPPHSDGNSYQKLDIGSDNPSLRSGISSPLSERGSDDGQKTKKPRKKPVYPADFEAFWSGYPTDENMSKAEAATCWKKLDADDRLAATEALPSFVAYCRDHPDYRPVHAVRFLSQRRFEGHAEAAKKVASVAAVFVKSDSPAWRAWDAYLRKTTGKGAQKSARHGGWWFPTEWPAKLTEEVP